MLEADVETTGLQSYHHEMFMAQFLGEGEPVWFHTEPGVVHPDVQKWLDSAASLGGIRAWNSKFDLGFFYRAGYKLPDDSLFHDGMVAAHIVDERFSVALKARGEKLFGADERDDEQQVKEWLAAERRARRKASKETGEEYTPPTYADVPDEIMVPYGVQDVVLQRKVCEVYEQALSTNDQLRDVYELERGVLAALFWAEMRGVPVDQEAAALYEASLLSGMDEAEDSLKRLAGIDTFNPNAPRQVAEALERRGVDLRGVPETPTGQRKMSADVLEAFGDPLASEVLRWKKNSKLLATYLGPLLHGKRDKVWGDSAPYITPDGRIHPNFKQTGAVTGRMSCIAEGELVDAPRDLVKHPDGIPIEEIRPGDMVYSFDAEGQPRPAAVKAVHQQGRKPVVKLIYRRRSGNASLGTLTATPDHRIALEDGTWKRMDELQPGDKLRFLSRTTYRGTAADTNHEVVCVVDEGQEIMTYDLTIDGAPNFVVNEISVHNCSEPNLQNWHRDDLSLRYLVRAEEGKKLVCCDLDAIEMKLFAAFAGRGVLLDQVKTGDPHAHTAQSIGIGDRIKPDGSVTPARQQAKTFNFCRPLDVEILTRTGWKTHDEVQVGDETVGYNIETGRTEWTPVLAVERGRGPLDRMGNKYWQVTATPNHRWLSSPLRTDHGAGGRTYAPLQRIELVEQQALLPQHSLIWNAPGDLGGPGAELSLDSKDAPDVLAMTNEQRRAWLHAMLLGEGYMLVSGRFSIAQNRGPILDAIELAILLEGYRPIRYDGGSSPSISVTGGRPYATTQRVTTSHVGVADVWCVQTGLGSWMAREGRHIGLTGNSMIYGGGVKTVMDTFGVSRSRAREMIDRFHSAYPEIGNLQQRIQAKLYDQGYVVTPWGRRHRVDERKQIHDQAYKFPNKLVQGTAADLLKDALVKIHKDGVPVILTVHDEIIAEVDESDAAEAAHLIEKHMTEHPRIDKVVPLQAEAQIVDRWSDAKTPGFVPTYIQES